MEKAYMMSLMFSKILSTECLIATVYAKTAGGSLSIPWWIIAFREKGDVECRQGRQFGITREWVEGGPGRPFP